jgi:Asp-tRNA(Asn)/Glu-tRNA(Gln) amidotransferase B subunit
MTAWNETGGFPVGAERLAALVALERDGTVSLQAAKRIFAELRVQDAEPRALAAQLGLVQVKDTDALGGWVDEVLAAFPGEVERYRSGEAKLMGFFVGQVMKRSQGKADPKGVLPLLQERLK